MTVLRKEACPTCIANGGDSSNDNRVVYEDGGHWCFACNQGSIKAEEEKVEFIEGEVCELRTRGISYETCKFFDYRVGRDNSDNWVQISNIYSADSKRITQHIRYADKKFLQIGQTKDLPLYGQWKWTPNEKLFVTITEGQIDALSIAQVQSCQYPVVSLPSGTGSAVKSIKHNLKWLLGFKYVVLAFDNDDAGQKATRDVLSLFEPGKVRVVTWPLKDANEMLLGGRGREISKLILQAKAYQPENIVTVSDIWDRILIQPTAGKPWPWKSLTDITYGQRDDIIIIVGATGTGKTEIVTSIIQDCLLQQSKVALFSFEQKPESTVLRLISKVINRRIYIPGSTWNEHEIKTIGEQFDNNVFLYDKAAKASLSEIFNSIRYLAKAKDCKLFIIDNLKGLKVSRNYDRAEELMLTLQELRVELGITIILLSHVSKDKYQFQTYVSTSPKNPDAYNSQTAEDIEELVQKPGLDWNSGRMPTMENVEGLSIVCDLADYVFGLARNKVSKDETEKRTIRVKCLKCGRLESSPTGNVFRLYYTQEGKLIEQDNINNNTDAF